MNSSSPVPRWETAVMVLSFVLLWGWFLARQAAVNGGGSINPVWNVALLASVIALVVVLVRRFKRTLEGLREVDPAQRGRRGNG